MASRLVSLFIFISLVSILCSHRVLSKADLLKNYVHSESLLKRFHTTLNNSINNVFNKTSKVKRIVDKKFKFPDISTLNVIDKTLDAPNISRHTGYIPIRNSYDARLFYFFFESRGSKNDPVVLWLTGGPGVGSAKALLFDNGPFHINEDLSLKWNDFGWDKVSNLLYVDQPTCTGFSYSSDHRDIRKSSKEVSNDLYDFLQTFFQTHLDLLKNDFYIAGASYSGHTIPLLASQIHTKNKATEGIHINLKGFAIMNGCTNSEYTHSSFPDFIYANKLILKSSYIMLNKFNKECLTLIKRCQTDDNVCDNARDLCDGIVRRMKHKMGHPNPYDFRNHCVNPPFYKYPRLINFLALNQVRSDLGVGNRTYATICREALKAMANDSMKNYATVIPPLLDNGIKVLIFDGEYDLMCNWLGNLRWMEAMKWSGRSQFTKTKLTSYIVNGKEVGKVKNIGPLTFLKVLNAGHAVSLDQPYVSLNIMKNWMNS